MESRGYLKYFNGVPRFTGFVDKDLTGRIHLSPYCFHSLDLMEKADIASAKVLNKFFTDKKIIFTESARSGLLILLKYILKLSRHDSVTIIKSLSDWNADYISSCVTRTIEKVCLWSHKIEKNTKVILLVHEFGYPCDLSKLKKYRGKYILVEDVAYGLGSRYKNSLLGNWGDYTLLSFPKIIPVQYGGALLGSHKLKTPLAKEQESYIKKSLSVYLPAMEDIVKIRIKNWNCLTRFFIKSKLSPLFPLTSGVNPGAFILDCRPIRGVNIKKMQCVKKMLNNFGIESTIYYPVPSLILPCHQELDKYSIGYIVGAVNYCFKKIFK